MSFKDTWIDQDETMDASPEVVNSIARAVIKNEEDIAEIKENGGTGGGSGESEQIFVNITKQTTGNSVDGITTTYTADKTYDEIYAAYQADKHIIAKVTAPNTNSSTGIYHLTAEEFGELFFTVIQWATIPAAAELVCYPNNTWVGRSNSLEVKENKVSKISSENPADYNYPSEKAVVDYVGDITGDIETALDNIIAIQNSLIGGDGE